MKNNNPDILRLLNIYQKIYPLDRPTKARLRGQIFSPPMVPILNNFFSSSKDFRVYLTPEQITFKDNSYEELLHFLPACKGKISEKEWYKGKNLMGVKVKKIITDLYTQKFMNKTQKNEFFDKFMLPAYEKVLSYKTAQDKDTALLVTKNPVDLYFCSASLSFDTCMDVTSPKGYVPRMGLINMVPDPSIFMVALTKGMRYMMYDGQLWKIPNIINRTFCRITEDGKLNVIRWFNGVPVSNDSLKELFGISKEATHSSKTTSFMPYHTTYEYIQENGGPFAHVPFYYLDDGRPYLNNNGELYFSAFGNSGYGYTHNYIHKNMSTGKLTLRDSGMLNGAASGFKPSLKITTYEDYIGGSTYLRCILCGEEWIHSRQPSRHKCNCTGKVKESFFGLSSEKLYTVYTAKKSVKHKFPKSNVISLLKSKDLIIKDRKLYLQGVA